MLAMGGMIPVERAEESGTSEQRSEEAGGRSTSGKSSTDRLSKLRAGAPCQIRRVSSRLAHMATCVHPRQAAVLLCTLRYSTVSSTVTQHLHFKPRRSGSKCKSTSYIVGTTVPFKVLYYKIKHGFLFFVFYVCVCVCVCIICVKSIINRLQCSTI